MHAGFIGENMLSWQTERKKTKAIQVQIQLWLDAQQCGLCMHYRYTQKHISKYMQVHMDVHNDAAEKKSAHVHLYPSLQLYLKIVRLYAMCLSVNEHV